MNLSMNIIPLRGHQMLVSHSPQWWNESRIFSLDGGENSYN